MVNQLKLGWIDYSSEHRNKVMAVLHALTAPEAVDELGIGLVRDGFADILFPGTSTIQTRAKYFFIVPYILMELEKVSFRSPKDFLNRLGEIEIDLIEVLNKDGVSGVIGGRAGRKLKRKPSSIYWNGLRTFGILKYDSLSLDNYSKAVFSMKENRTFAINSGNEENDDIDTASGEYSSTFWRCLLPDPSWKENITMDLSREEALYLKERIVKAPKSKDTLFAYLLNQDSSVLQVDTFEQIGEKYQQLPEQIQKDYRMANKFSEFISGANIRYNVVLSNGENENANEKWNEWINSPFVKYEFHNFDFVEVINRLQIKNMKLVRFLNNWQQVVASGNDKEIDELIIRREIELKSKDRAKLQNSKVYKYEEGNWVGSDKLVYRFPVAKDLMKDIYDGLED
ncbi:DUF6361 family protein [Fredinandcohnia sp. 179-A 10B2 NHS]|uniref:DUF6361 family protein n=1 Tax=Fredinandcohnia sp. 179-A 10B2 NHS TaxID=3235176 RepID=UPI0039A36095